MRSCNRRSVLRLERLLRLCLSTLAMTVPFFLTLTFAMKDRRSQALPLFGKVGVPSRFSFWVLILCLFTPFCINRWRQRIHVRQKGHRGPHLLTEISFPEASLPNCPAQEN